MDTNVLTDRMLEDIAVRMKHIEHAVKPSGYVSNLKKITLFNTEDNVQACDALDFLENWVTKSQQPFCALLGEYGMGKTTACMLLTQILLKKRKDNPLLPLPIYLDLRQIGKKDHFDEISLPALIDMLLLHSVHGGVSENALSAKDVIHLVQQEGALIIFDGLDEVLVHMSTMAGQRFTRKLLSIAPIKKIKGSERDASGIQKMGRILLTCRTHYFRTMREQKTHFLMEDRGGITADDYSAFILLPFTDSQIREYLTYAVPNFDIDALLDLLHSVHNLTEMAERPYTLSLIPNLIPNIEKWKAEGSRVTGATVYRSMVLSWLARDKGKHRIIPDHKLMLMEHLAAEMWQTNKKLWGVLDVENWLVRFLHHHPEIEAHYTYGIEEGLLYHMLEMLKEDLRTATFLVRVGEKDFRFAHTSLQEFFLASYLCHALIEDRIDAWSLPLASKETIDFLGQILSEKSENTPIECTKAINSLSKIKEQYLPRASEQALNYLVMAFHKGYPGSTCEKFCLDGAQLSDWSIQGKKGLKGTPHIRLDFREATFKQANLKRANLRYLDVDHTNFTNADFSDGEFFSCKASGVNFSEAILDGTFFMDVDFEGSDFTGTSIGRTEWLRCSLDGVKNFQYLTKTALFGLCRPETLLISKIPDVSAPDVGHEAPVPACALSADGMLFATASMDVTLRIWDVNTYECVRTFLHKEWVLGSAFFPNQSKKIISTSVDHKIRAWDIATGECFLVLTGHEGPVRSCVFIDAEGRYLASTSDDNTMRIWDILEGKCLYVCEGHTAEIRGSAFSSVNGLLATAADDSTLRIWNVHTGACLMVLGGHLGWVRQCVFSTDGSLLISTSEDKTIKIWDVKTWECLKTLRGHESWVRACSITPDGKIIASVSYDHTVRLWDVATGNNLKILKGHTSRVRGCQFYAGGGRLVTVSDDLTLRFWDVERGECLKIIGGEK
ncbi:MAG: pentapeptide repeat-containing protein [Pseudomonadota bacterium]